MKKHFKKQKGFIVLFTVFLVTIVLAIAIGIANVALKEIVLSKTASEAAGSFLAADSGVECALYRDMVSQIFLSDTPPTQLSCGNQTIPLINTIGGLDFYNYEFYVPVDMAGVEENTHCAYVTIAIQVSGSNPPYNKVVSRGYNVSCDILEDSEGVPARSVERAIEVTYYNNP